MVVALKQSAEEGRKRPKKICNCLVYNQILIPQKFTKMCVRTAIWIMRRTTLAIATCCMFSIGSLAQATPAGQLPETPSASAQSQTTSEASNPVESGVVLFQLLEKKSLVFPDLATHAKPFGARQKFELAANNSVSLYTVGAALLGAAYGQAINSPSGYGQGAEGYGKRLGADMARAASYNLFGPFLLATALGEDPRFYVKKNLSFKQSAKYAAIRLVKTRNDSGEEVIYFAALLGSAAGEALANTYYPPGNRGVGSTLTRYASDQGWRFAANLLRQYWPTINKKLVSDNKRHG
jgi:hypothetical protein